MPGLPSLIFLIFPFALMQIGVFYLAFVNIQKFKDSFLWRNLCICVIGAAVAGIPIVQMYLVQGVVRDKTYANQFVFIVAIVQNILAAGLLLVLAWRQKQREAAVKPGRR
jgi:hypothetical protein